MIAPPKEDIIKDDILKEAQKLFQQFGLKKTTMEDIAKSMGKGKSTLYYYYCSKEEIFDAVVLKETNEVFNLARQAVEKADTAEQKLEMFAITKIKALQKKANLYRIIRGEMLDNMHCVKHLYTEYDLQETNLVRNILNYGISNGEFTEALKKDMDVLPSLLVSSLRGIERDMFISNKYTQFGNRIAAIVAVMINGIKN